MDLHRLRVVEFDTSIREREREKKYIAELEACKEEDGSSSTVGNKNQSVNERLNDNKSYPGLPQKCPDEKVSPPGTSKKYLDDTSSPPGTSKKICVNDEITSPRTSEKYLNDTTSARHPESSKKQKSKSEIFKMPPKKKPRRRALKINSSDIGLKKLFQDSAYSNQKKRTVKHNRNRNTRVHHNEENVKEKEEKIEEVQFLFARETPSFLRFRRKRTENEKTKKKHDFKLPNDIDGFQKSNRSLDQNQYHMSSFNFLDIDKLPLIKLRGGFHRKPKPPPPLTNCFCKHHAMRVLKSTYGYGLNGQMLYNLGTHRHPRISRSKTVRVERSRMAKDVTVKVSSSSLKSTSFRDAGTGPNKVKAFVGSTHHSPPRVLEKSTTLQNVTSANEYNQKPCPCAASAHHPPSIIKKTSTLQNVGIASDKQNTLPCTLCGGSNALAKNEFKKKRCRTILVLIKTICKGFITRIVKHVTDLHTKHHLSGKSCIKYIFFGLLIVVWSPCLLAVILAWIVMFPWKLTNIFKTDVSKRSFSINNSIKKRFRKKNLRREYQQMCFEDYLPKKKKSFMTTAANWYSRTVGAIAKSFSAAISLLKVKKEPPTRSCSSYFIPHPNPRERYTFSCADRRGWVMKPSRRRTRSRTSNHVMQSMRCEFRPKRCHKPRHLNLLQKSCPLQSTRPVWPGCTFWNNYALKYSSRSVPLESSHRRRQQVNIPSNLFCPTSGVASISGVKPPNTNYYFLNSNETVNNIAHKDAKDHPGQRKIGTRVVVNYPCWTKPPQTTNLETFRAHKFGLADKKNITAKCATKHDVASALIKALARVHRITSLTYSTNSMTNSKLNRLREQTTKSQIPLNCPSVRNQKLAIKQANMTNNLNYAHKTQNTSKHILHPKITNKSNKTEKIKPEKASKCACEAKLLPPKQEYKNKTNKTRAQTRKHLTPAKIKSNIKHDIILNYSLGNNLKQYKPNQIPVATQMLSKITDTTTMTKRHLGLNYPRGEKHKQSKHCSYGNKPYQIPVATQKQLSTANITTGTNRNVALNCPCKQNRGSSKHGYKHKPHQIPVTTQMLSKISDKMTMANRGVRLNYPCREKHEQSKNGYGHKPHQIPVGTQKQLSTANITTGTNRNVAMNCPCKQNRGSSKLGYKHNPHQIPVATKMQFRTAENVADTNRAVALNRSFEENHELSEHAFKHKQHRIAMATQMQSRTADNATVTKRDVALNHSFKEKHELSQQGYKHKLHRIPVATQMLSNTADITTMTNRNICLKRPCGEKQEQSRHCCGNQPHQIPAATQKQLSTANITTGTNRNVALNRPCKQNRGSSKLGYKHKPLEIPVATEMQSRTADNATDTNRDVALNYPDSNKLSPAKKGIPSKANKNMISTQKTGESECISKKQEISIQKQSYKIDASANCGDYERSKTKVIFRSEQNVSPKEIIFEQQADKNIFAQYASKSQPFEQNLNTFLRESFSTSRVILANSTETKPFKQPPSQNSSRVGSTFETGNASATQPLSTKQLQTEEFIEQVTQVSSIQGNSQQLKIASDCDCGVSSQTGQLSNKQKGQTAVEADGQPKLPQHLSSLEPVNPKVDKTLLKVPKPQERLPSKISQKTSTLIGIASDCHCGVGFRTGQVPNKQTCQTAIDGDGHPISSQKFPSLESDKPEVEKTLFKFPKQQERLPSKMCQKTSTLFGIASDCHCGVAYQTGRVPNKQTCQTAIDGDGHPILSQKFPSLEPDKPEVEKTLFKYPKQQESLPSKMSQKTSTLFGIASDCHCGVASQTGQVLNKQTCQTAIDGDGHPISSQKFPSLEPDIPEVEKTLFKFPKQQERLPTKMCQKTSTLFGIASDCHCGVASQTGQVPNKQTCQTTIDGDGHPISSQKNPSLEPEKSEVEQTLFKFPKQQKSLPSKMSQKTSTLFGIASDCHCGVASQTGQVPNKQTCQTTIYGDGHPISSQTISSLEPDISEVEQTLFKFPKQQERLPTKMSQKTSTLFGIASDCHCGVRSQTGQVPNKQTCQTALYGDGHRILSQKFPSLEPDKPEVEKTLVKFPKQQESLPSKMSQKTSTLFGIASDCHCGVASQTGQVPNKQTCQTAIDGDGHPISSHKLPSLEPDIPEVEKTLFKFPKQQERLPTKMSQKTSTLFGIASDCHCGVRSQTGQVPNKQTCQTALYGDGHRILSQKFASLEPDKPEVEKTLFKFPKQQESLPSKMSQKTSTLFGIASDCRCGVRSQTGQVSNKQTGQTATSRTSQEELKSFGLPSYCAYATNQSTTAGKSLYNKVMGSKSTTAKETEHSPLPKSLPRKCRCPVLQDSIGKQPYGTKVSIISSRRKYIVKINKTRSKHPKSPDINSPIPTTRPRKCRCSIESFQDSVDEQPFGTNVSLMPCRRKYNVKVDKTRSKYPESPDNSQISNSLPCKCRRLIESLQYSVDEQPYGNKVSTTSSERGIAKVKLRQTFSKSSDRSPPLKTLPRECPCPIGSLQNLAGKQSHGTEVSTSSSSRNIVKVKPRSKFFKSSDRSPPLKTLPRECPCPIESLQNLAGKQSHGTVVSTSSSSRKHNVKVGKTRSKYPESPLPQSLLYKCSGLVESLQGKKLARTKANKTISKRNSTKVDKTSSKFAKLSDRTPPQEHLNCSCPVGSLHDPVSKKSFQSSRKSFFSRKSKRGSIECPCSALQKLKFSKLSYPTPPQEHLKCSCPVGTLHDPVGKKSFQGSRKSFFSRKSKRGSIECPCSALQNDPNKICLKSDVSVNWNTTKQSFIRSCGRTESSGSVNEIAPRFQCSRISQCASKVSSLVMSLRSKLFSRKISKQTNIPDKPTMKPKSVDKRDISMHDILEAMLDDESKRSLFRQSRNSKTSQNQYLPTHSIHSTACLLRKSSWRQFTKNIRKPWIVDKSYSCLHNLSLSSKYEVRSKSRSQQSKTSEHSSIVTLFTRKSHSKLAQKKPFKKYAPQYSSSLIKHTTPAARQTVPSQFPPSPRTYLLNRCQPKPLMERIRSVTAKISTNSRKYKEEKSSSTLSVPTALIYLNKSSSWPIKRDRITKKISQDCRKSLENISPSTATLSGDGADVDLHKTSHKNKLDETHQSQIDSLHGSSPPKQLTVKIKNLFDTIPQQPKAEKEIPNVSVRCDDQKNITTKHLSNNKLQLNSDIQKLPIFRPLNNTNSTNSHSLPFDNYNQRFQSPAAKHHAGKTLPSGMEHKIVQRSAEISQSPDIQQYSKIYAYQQNLLDQNLWSRIPINLDNPPPGLLQPNPNSPGYGRKRKNTAKGGVRQPYPDFNRVSMRYTGHTSRPQHLRPPTNNYPPAPGATPPRNYTCDPCYANPRSTCVPQPCFDESALRRAYKRRPLRYTPPSHQLPRVFMNKKLLEDKKRAAERKRKKKRKLNIFQCLRRVTKETERQFWPNEVTCHPMWINTLKQKPCFFIYKIWPRVYPAFLNFYKTQQCLCKMLVYFLTLCFWSPLLLCAYMCCSLCHCRS